MPPPPPRPPLFPYTTLFRSPGPAVSQRTPAELGQHSANRYPQIAAAYAQLGWQNSSKPPDRKSTRLNSSHLVISYAVFCLKKKNLHLLCLEVDKSVEQKHDI